MDPTKWRISKACEECRVRKIRCDGGSPCQRCQTRNVACEYRKKARNRMKRQAVTAAAAPFVLPQHTQGGPNGPGGAGQAGQSSQGSQGSQGGQATDKPNMFGASAATAGKSSGLYEAIQQAQDTPRSSIQNHSVAATHRASPSVFLQLYYGPSSTFTLLNSIYHQVEGTLPAPNAAKEVEEIGPGLDLFNIRRLYFGDLVGVETGNALLEPATDIFLERATAEGFLEKYLATFWHVMPIWSKEEYRMRLNKLYSTLDLYTMENPESVIVLLTLALGASLLDKDNVARHLFRKAKRWAAALDDMVNVQTVQISLLMSHFCAEDARPNSGFLLAGTAVRKAVAAGLHKDVTGSGQSPDNARQGRITIWSAYFWETWLCFSLGRPSSFPEAEIDVPFPKEEKMLQSLVLLSRIMSKCVARIYREHHESLLPIWNAANEIRRDLRHFAKQQQQDLNFGLASETYDGELGVCQSIVSTMYHHTLLLTFRPFLVLRAKLQQEMATDGRSATLPKPPAWLDTACEYCLDAARHAISYMAGAVERNELCRAIKYHGFFIEGSSQVLAFYLLQDKEAGRENMPWIQLATRALQMIRPRSRMKTHSVDLLTNLEQMVQAVYPDFQADQVEDNRNGNEVGIGDNTSASSVGTSNANTNSAGANGIGANSVGANSVNSMNSVNSVGASNSSGGSLATVSPAAAPVQDASFAPHAAAAILPAVHPPAFPFTPFGLEESGPPSNKSPSTSTLNPEGPTDLTAADMGWNFDFSTMNMEAFLTIDPNMTDLNTYR